MKKITTLILTVSVFLLQAQTFTETITKEFKFEKQSPQNTIILANINGSMKVEGYTGDKVLLTIERTIKAKTEERLEKGKKEMNVSMIDQYDTIIYYVGGGCNHFKYKSKGNRSGWGYHWDCDDDDRDCKQQYDYKFNFTVKVPSQMNVIVSTVNDGNVTVTQVKGAVKANNVNGAITLAGLEGPAEAHTINGDVDLDYTKNPNGNCRFYTLNGDINANFVKGLAANMAFKSFNGDFYTNLPDLTSLPFEVLKEKDENGFKLKAGGSRYKVRQGGALLDFETFNGDAIVKEK